MIEAGEKAVGFSAERSRTDLESDEMLRFALVKLVEIVGEAAKQVSDETRGRHPAVAWAGASRNARPARASLLRDQPRHPVVNRHRGPAAAAGSAARAKLTRSVTASPRSSSTSIRPTR